MVAAKPATRAYTVFAASTSNENENKSTATKSEGTSSNGLLTLIGADTKRKPLTMPVLDPAKMAAKPSATAEAKSPTPSTAPNSKPANRYLHSDPWMVSSTPTAKADADQPVAQSAPRIFSYGSAPSPQLEPASVSLTNRKSLVAPMGRPKTLFPVY